MFKYYRDYYWKNGKPCGIELIDPDSSSHSYKIVSDPYHKRLSLEKYQFTRFEKVIYDSLLLDFRKLTPLDHLAWQREVLKEEDNQTLCLLRNQDDRVVLTETLTFEQNHCRTCRTSSVHGLTLATHRMYYRWMQDPFDGVVLYDLEERPVMMKEYETDLLTGEFTNLLSEEWNMDFSKCQKLLSLNKT